MPQSSISYETLKKEKGQKCCNCNSSDSIQYHHIIPLAIGGNDILTNIVPLCEKCHLLIHNKNKTNKLVSHSELTKRGLEKARKEGKQIGLKKGTKLTTDKSIAAKEIILKYNIDFGGELDNQQTIKLAGISRNTFYKYKKELREE
jgi:hypothetical protein